MVPPDIDMIEIPRSLSGVLWHMVSHCEHWFHCSFPFLKLWRRLTSGFMMEGITTCCGWPWVLNDHDQSHLARIVCSNRQNVIGSYYIHIHIHIQQISVHCSLASKGHKSRRPTRMSHVNTMTLGIVPHLSTWIC